VPHLRDSLTVAKVGIERQLDHPKSHVISTEAANGLTVRCAVERFLYFLLHLLQSLWLSGNLLLPLLLPLSVLAVAVAY
jgi:hypothetical protein